MDETRDVFRIDAIRVLLVGSASAHRYARRGTRGVREYRSQGRFGERVRRSVRGGPRLQVGVFVRSARLFRKNGEWHAGREDGVSR